MGWDGCLDEWIDGDCCADLRMRMRICDVSIGIIHAIVIEDELTIARISIVIFLNDYMSERDE